MHEEDTSQRHQRFVQEIEDIVIVRRAADDLLGRTFRCRAMHACVVIAAVSPQGVRLAAMDDAVQLARDTFTWEEFNLLLAVLEETA